MPGEAIIEFALPRLLLPPSIAPQPPPLPVLPVFAVHCVSCVVPFHNAIRNGGWLQWIAKGFGPSYDTWEWASALPTAKGFALPTIPGQTTKAGGAPMPIATRSICRLCFTHTCLTILLIRSFASRPIGWASLLPLPPDCLSVWYRKQTSQSKEVILDGEDGYSISLGLLATGQVWMDAGNQGGPPNHVSNMSYTRPVFYIASAAYSAGLTEGELCHYLSSASIRTLGPPPIPPRTSSLPPVTGRMYNMGNWSSVSLISSLSSGPSMMNLVSIS
ncbi:hypothetical protein BZA05DRAFT_409839 [Tricharina praecox]|uniref:uncharacterized protein n=1 Tax=Tricharina praecox TaxID=43433 RepID=UPI0022201361|nr:uncharacterized protein BZA05DRAFT_412091 [Tricharina praecox]XP_051335725.1 uncharacterized protein BZA05DRAFT_409839 [Tricharina praecox]KAI5842736.1 hypothetical protein BZA05DRAFT_412091 [Tricharina praecox]KAI5844076.1 hypothetical protein BZA05DRAFT_409839 [Tricharina praecox]